MIACTEKGSAVRLFPTRHGREIAARPGGATPRMPARLAIAIASAPGTAAGRGRAGRLGVWAINHALRGPLPRPRTCVRRGPGLLGAAGRQLFGGDHHVALARPVRAHSWPAAPTTAALEEKGRGDHFGFGAGSETTQVHCRKGPRARGPSSTTYYVRTCVRASSDAARVAVHGANNWETTAVGILQRKHAIAQATWGSHVLVHDHHACMHACIWIAGMCRLDCSIDRRSDVAETTPTAPLSGFGLPTSHYQGLARVMPAGADPGYKTGVRAYL